ncbi:hypothetical protein R1flu_002837 [Riccia fluitans]|uniref:Uncharacterized protein n=1 Tax=Riccia fluitans TaxID=41844 RepID=A0ABD1Y788_9MARC
MSIISSCSISSEIHPERDPWVVVPCQSVVFTQDISAVIYKSYQWRVTERMRTFICIDWAMCRSHCLKERNGEHPTAGKH